MQQRLIVFTDGACSANGKTEARAGYGVYVVDRQDLCMQGRLPEHERQTNQRAELYAILHAFDATKNEDCELVIYSDSQYSVNIFNEWLPNWLKKGITKENWDIIMPIHEMSKNRKFKLIHVKAHRKITDDMDAELRFIVEGNAKADQFATGAIQIVK